MSELPNGWAETTLGEITDGGVDQGGPEPTGDSFCYVDISSIDKDTKRVAKPQQLAVSDAPSRARQRLEPGDVVVSMTRPNLNAVALLSEDLAGSIGSTGFHVLRSREMSPRWLAYRVQAPDFVSAMSMRVQGALYPAVRPNDIAQFATSIPPRPEQNRIVEEIEKQFTRLDAATAALKRVQANLKRYRASVLKAAREGQLVPTDAALAHKEGRDYEPASELLKRILRERRARWEADTMAKLIASGKPPKDDHWKEKYKEPSFPETSGLPELPEGWCWAALDQLFAVERGRFSVRPRNDPRFYGGAYPFVQIGDLPRDGGPILKFSQSLNNRGLSISRVFKAGTVLIAIVGATIGNTGVLSFDACCPDSLVGLQTDDPVTLRYAEYVLRANKLEIRSASYASGGQPNINLAFLGPYPIPVPPQRELQRIVEELDRVLSSIECLEPQIQNQLAHGNGLRRSILNSAFSGRLVPQDPRDEPASVLLERIRAERSAQQKPAQSRKRREPAHV